MLFIYAVANAFTVSGAHEEFTKWGRWPKAAPIMCSASIESSSLRILQKHWTPIVLQALAYHILQKPHVLKTAL